MNINKHIISFFALFLFTFLAIGSTDEDEAIELEISTKASVHTVTATKLCTEYENNEVAADLKYKDKVITVSGVVDEIAKDFLDDIYVSLKGDAYELLTVQCYFSDSHTDKAASLKSGDKITIKGLGGGSLMGLGAVMNGCVVVEGSTNADEAIESEIPVPIPVQIPVSSSVHTVTATKLCTEYENNEVAADLKYKDKVITVSGVVDEIAKDFLDDIYVSLKGDGFITTVQCYFSDSHTDKAASLNKGDRITIQGLGGGSLMGLGAIINGCVFVE